MPLNATQDATLNGTLNVTLTGSSTYMDAGRLTLPWVGYVWYSTAVTVTVTVTMAMAVTMAVH